ncbi:MAG: class I SAM-dependent methyltransferase [Leptospiraceae bacterium]|nr:class I SAM-dependent methyltransferase [Leptospiraceae bacterium]
MHNMIPPWILHPLARRLYDGVAGNTDRLPARPQLIAAESNLAQAWHCSSGRALLLQVLEHGFFLNQPAIGERFVELLANGIESEPNQNAIYSHLHTYVKKTMSARKALQRDSRHRIKRRLEQLRQFLPAQMSSLLDMGNGNGEITDLLARYYKLDRRRALGIDTVERAHPSRFYRQIYVSPTETIPVADASFQVITMLMVLHHSQNPVNQLREAWRVLRRGGELLIRESDVVTYTHKNFNAVMEDFYYRVFNNFPKIALPNYHLPAAYWIRFGQDCGFRLIEAAAVEASNPFAPVYIHLRKE